MSETDKHLPKLAKIALSVPLYRLFDYIVPADIAAYPLEQGSRVLVPFAKQEKVGVLMDIVSIEESTIDRGKLKTILKLIDEKSLLSKLDIGLLQWAARYYHHPLGEVLAAAFPVALRKGKAAQLTSEKCYRLTQAGEDYDLDQLARAPQQRSLLTSFRQAGQPLNNESLQTLHPQWRSPLNALLKKGLIESVKTVEQIKPSLQQPLQANPQQQQAIDSISAGLGSFSVFLLEGITGSGKTEVYMQVISEALRLNLQILVLLPEISLTPQLEFRFRQRFNVPIVAFHSRLTGTQRTQAWLNTQQGRASILLGTRSALFTPMPRLGLIILDEEHDTSFKQQEGFRYSARDVAVMRAKQLNIPIVMGSATPSLESLHNVNLQRYRILHLPQRAGNAKPPTLQLLDIRNKKMQDGLSEYLLSEIRKTLAEDEQVLLFLNRRGYAPVQMCHSCGYVSKCRRCDANLVVHFQEQRLRCHHCGADQPLPNVCPDCRKDTLQTLGSGTERVEQTLNDYFADKKIVRLDRDTIQQKGAMESLLEQINHGDADIILGTQMLAKGHHFARVTLVALLDVDSGLYSIDYHSPERLAQLIVQVAGRAGRAEKPGKVILQTRHPDHPLLLTLLQQGYQAFASNALIERQQAALPPYAFHALMTAQATKADAPQQFLNAAATLCQPFNLGKVNIMGPVPAPMTRKSGLYRYQLLFHSNRRQALHDLLDSLMAQLEKNKSMPKVRWSLDIDPVDLY